MSSNFKMHDFVSCGRKKKSYFDTLNLHPEGNNEKAATLKEFTGQRFPGEIEGAMQVAPNEDLEALGLAPSKEVGSIRDSGNLKFLP